MIKKHSSILRFVESLIEEFGRDGILFADFWDADRFAVGVKHHDRPDRLIYICTYGKAIGLCDCHLETGLEQSCPQSSKNAGSFDNIGQHELLKIARAFWSREKP